MNFLGLIRFKPCRVSWLLGILHVLVKRMPDKAFWTPRYQGAADELKPCLSGTDIVLVLILMEATLGQRSLRRVLSSLCSLHPGPLMPELLRRAELGLHVGGLVLSGRYLIPLLLQRKKDSEKKGS